jgi:hypothetical protein
MDKSLLERPVRSSILATLLDLLGASSVSSAWFDHVAKWHFPGADKNQPVVPGSTFAKREIEKGIKRCNLKIFSKGLHQLQDSFSHRSGGQMPPWMDRVGHSKDQHGWYWEEWDKRKANPLVGRPHTIRAIQLACLMRYPFWSCGKTRILKASRRAYTIYSTDADSVALNIFGNAYGETEDATKEEMDRFRTKCPCIKDGPHAGECVICQGLAKPKD